MIIALNVGVRRLIADARQYPWALLVTHPPLAIPFASVNKKQTLSITITGSLTPGVPQGTPDSVDQYTQVLADDARTLFERWYVKPLTSLEQLPDGDGGFVVLATCCFLYERYANALLDSQQKTVTPNALVAQFAADFSVDSETAKAFWKVIRHGFLHQGMPMQHESGKKTLPDWATSQDFRAPVEFDRAWSLLKIQPWLFRDKVLALYRARPDLIAHNNSFPWGKIFARCAVPF